MPSSTSLLENESEVPPPTHYHHVCGQEERRVVEHSTSNYPSLPGQSGISGLKGSEMSPWIEPPETILHYKNDVPQDGTGNGLIMSVSNGEPDFDGAEPSMLAWRKSVNTTECISVPSSEHVAEIVGRQGCKIKALRAKTNTYIKTPVRGEKPVFVVTGRKEDVVTAKKEILSAAEHFSLIRASRNQTGASATLAGPGLPGPPFPPGQTTIQVRVPYRVVGLVVGPRGATIKRIQQQTHTYIMTPSRDKEPVFEVTGMPENVDRAREEIEAHIEIRTGTGGGGGSSVEACSIDETDFHYNGTDVSFERDTEGLDVGQWVSSEAPPTPLPSTKYQPANSNVNGICCSAEINITYRNDSSSSLDSGSGSTDSCYTGSGSGGNGNSIADLSPISPFNANANNNNGNVGGTSFWFGETALPLGSEELLRLSDRCGLSTTTDPSCQPQVIWSNFIDRDVQLYDCVQSQIHHQLQNSQPCTPRISPTFLGVEDLEQARRVLALLCSAAAPDIQRFQAYGHALSYSESNTTSSSPSDSLLLYKPGAGVAHSQECCIHCMESQVLSALVPCGQTLCCNPDPHLCCVDPQICQGP
ncbi:RNA-binding E3 ubiquitin-protein ligase MEX3C-like [Aplochiton taeniatus]